MTKTSNNIWTDMFILRSLPTLLDGGEGSKFGNYRLETDDSQLDKFKKNFAIGKEEYKRK